jgi:hypothetical protein
MTSAALLRLVEGLLGIKRDTRGSCRQVVSGTLLRDAVRLVGKPRLLTVDSELGAHRMC